MNSGADLATKVSIPGPSSDHSRSKGDPRPNTAAPLKIYKFREGRMGDFHFAPARVVAIW
jgi:hypothetical protein